MKFAIIGDTHLGCSTYSDKRASDFSKQFNRAIETAINSRVQGVFLLGDIFDSSAYRRNVDNFASSLREIAQSLVSLKKAEIPIFAIPGNHEYGRGRGGGELRILSDLGFINLLDDKKIEFGGYEIVGISWKSNIETFREVIKKLGPPKSNSILLIHQFCFGSSFIPPMIAEIGKQDLDGWATVFCGHHHHYENLDYVLLPGSLEIQEAKEVGQKGFIVYDSNSQTHEFIRLEPSRPVHHLNLNGAGLSASDLEKQIEEWIDSKSSSRALLVIELRGRLASGRSIDINWNQLRSRAIQNGCLKFHVEGGLEDEVRSAPEIRTTMSIHEFLNKRFGEKGKIALQYVQSFKEKGDDYGSDILTAIIDGVKSVEK